MQVCLPVCGHGRGNRAPCAGRSICASFAPLGVYIYAFGGESCTTRLTLLRSARQDPDRDRAWHPRVLGPVGGRSSLTPGKSASPPARCIHRPQRYTSSADTPPRLARARWRITRAVTAPFPCVRSFRPPPWARPSIRRVFLRSLCARRLIVVSLNNLQPLPRFCKLSYARRKYVAVRL